MICRTNFSKANLYDILYSDFSFSADFNTDKTAIGVIIKKDGNQLLVIPKKHFQAPEYQSGCVWSSINVDTLIPNVSEYPISDFDGERYTNIIGNNDHYPAFQKALIYCPVSNPELLGKFYLPAGGEMYYLIQNRIAINNALQKIGGDVIISFKNYQNAWYWISNERNSTESFVIRDGKTSIETTSVPKQGYGSGWAVYGVIPLLKIKF